MTAIDILLAVYNGEEFLPDFLDSLVRQSFRDFRLIVSDNMSSDRTLSILEEYRARLARPMFLLPPQNAFVSAHANFARVTEAAENEYIMFADADDVWHNDKIEISLVAMKKAEAQYGAGTPILVHSDLTVVNRNLRQMHPSFWRYQFIDPRRTGLNQLLLQNCVTGCTAMLNRPLWALGRPIPLDACAHDHWYALVASAFGRVVPIPESLIEYRQHGSNVTGAKRWGIGYVADRARQFYGTDGARQTIARNIRQAEMFLSRFTSRLSQDQRQLVQNFAGIRNSGVISRRYALIQNAFWKRGLVRNLGLLLAI